MMTDYKSRSNESGLGRGSGLQILTSAPMQIRTNGENNSYANSLNLRATILVGNPATFISFIKRFVKMVLFIFPAFALTSLRAQEKWIQDFEVFAGVGQIDNTGSGYYLDNSDTKASFSFGFGANHYFGPLFDLNVRIGYERRGLKYSEYYYDPVAQENQTVQLDKSINSFTLQLLPVFKVGTQRKIRFGIGPYFSVPYNTVSVLKRFDKNGNQIAQSGNNTTKQYRDVVNDFGLTAFLGYSFKAGQFNELAIQAMINHGVIFYAKASGGDVQNRIYALVISYRYHRKIFR